MPIARNINSEFGKFTTKRVPSRAPMACTAHPDKIAKRYVGKVGFCSACHDRAVKMARGTLYATKERV